MLNEYINCICKQLDPLKLIVMKRVLFFLFILIASKCIAQDICTDNITAFIDVNAVDKCTKEPVNKKPISPVLVSLAKRRFFIKRKPSNKAVSVLVTFQSKNIDFSPVINDFSLSFIHGAKVTLALKENKPVLFDIVDEIPMFISCSNSIIEKATCFNYEMQKHIESNFLYPLKAIERGVEGEVIVSFIINSLGKVTDVKAEGSDAHKLLKDEAKRIISLLPSFIPGKHNQEETNVLYSFPMSFSLDSLVE